MNRKILMLALLMCATPGLATGASVYKWTDENGVTHFGDRQPTGGKAEQIKVRPSTGPGSNSKRQSLQERVNAMEEQEQQDQQRRNETAVQEAQRKQREANCATARSNLQIIQSNARIRTEGEDGEIRYLTPEEIEERRQQFEQIAEENCGPMEENPER
jgi:molecular chaperone DnaK (HSP70)